MTQITDQELIKEQMLKARAYIQLKEYDKARRILVNVDHPKAKEWLTKLPSKRSRKPEIIVASVLIAFLSIIVGIVIGIKLGGRGENNLSQIYSASSEPATKENTSIVVIPTTVPNPTLPPTWTPTTSPSITPTPYPTRSRPPTNIPTENPYEQAISGVSSRDNPFPIDYKSGMSSGYVGDAIMGVGILPNMSTDIILSFNMFNTEPSQGEEWVAIYIGVSCLEGEICEYSSWDFSLVADSGRVYEPEIIAGLPADLELPGTIYGGDTSGGLIGFVVDSQDIYSLILIYQPNMFEDIRYFFRAVYLPDT